MIIPVMHLSRTVCPQIGLQKCHITCQETVTIHFKQKWEFLSVSLCSVPVMGLQQKKSQGHWQMRGPSLALAVLAPTHSRASPMGADTTDTHLSLRASDPQIMSINYTQLSISRERERLPVSHSLDYSWFLGNPGWIIFNLIFF